MWCRSTRAAAGPCGRRLAAGLRCASSVVVRSSPPHPLGGSASGDGGGVTGAYAAAVATGRLSHRPAQATVAAALDRLAANVRVHAAAAAAAARANAERAAAAAAAAAAAMPEPASAAAPAAATVGKISGQLTTNSALPAPAAAAAAAAAPAVTRVTAAAAAPVTAPRGIYLWGAVGSGKTMLMDWFAAGGGAGAARCHFHDFMLGVHERLHAVNAADLAARGRPSARTILHGGGARDGIVQV